jgi:hypothetical protein
LLAYALIAFWVLVAAVTVGALRSQSRMSGPAIFVVQMPATMRTSAWHGLGRPPTAA